MEQHEQDEAVLANLSQPVELTNLAAHASHTVHLNHDWVAYLDGAHMPTHVAGIDDSIHHRVGDQGGTAYA